MSKELLFAISAVCAYLISGINSAIIFSKAIYHTDIRTVGSRNPGFTNFKRVFGGKFAWFVFVIDILKCVLPCLVFGWLFGKLYGIRQLGVAFTGFFAMLGHAYPVWYGFKGGKAFLVGAGAIWLTDWRAGAVATVVFLILLFTVRYMSLSSICAAVTCPVSLAILGTDSKPFVLIFCIASSAFMIWRHKSNIARLIKGTESKFSLFGKSKKAEVSEAKA